MGLLTHVASVCSRRLFSSPSAQSQLLHFCVVGTGPAGFYAADRLLKNYGQHARVSLVDRLPTPFGLVRSGVAPDHQDTKNVINQFTATGADPRVSFFGNVHVGTDVQLSELRQRFHAVVLAMGAESDKRLGVPGEVGPGVLSAREFVWWYNGHPDARDLPVDLSHVRSVAVCGIGNVALDCARLLLRPPDTPVLSTSDLAAHAAAALKAASSLSDVHLVARRGPVQAACTPKELRELVREPGLTVRASQAQLALSAADTAEMKSTRIKRRVYDIITQAVQAGPVPVAIDPQSPPAPPPRRLHFQFYRQPKEVLRDPVTKAVTGLKVEVTALQEQPGKPAVAVGTGVMEVIPADLVLVSIGYRSLPMPGAPFDMGRGIILNENGRVLGAEGSNSKYELGLYVCGWAKRGPTGIIGTNLVDADDTLASLAEDLAQGALRSPVPTAAPVPNTIVPPVPASQAVGAESLMQLLSARGRGAVVDWAGWGRLDGAEVAAGRAVGKVREKLVRVEDMLRACECGTVKT